MKKELNHKYKAAVPDAEDHPKQVAMDLCVVALVVMIKTKAVVLFNDGVQLIILF